VPKLQVVDKLKVFWKHNRRITAVLLILMFASGLFLWQSGVVTAGTNLTVLIIDTSTTNTSGANMQTVLQGLGYTVTRQSTLPTITVANGYDVVIYNSGINSGASGTVLAEAQFLRDYLNSGTGHLIIEGEAIYNDINTVDPADVANILKINTSVAVTTGKFTRLTVSDNSHPVTKGLALTSATTFANATQDVVKSGIFTAPASAEIVMISNLGNAVNVWDSGNGRRLVYMPFSWYVNTSNYITDQTFRETFLKNAVAWVGENLSITGTSRAPVRADQGAVNVVMESLTLQANKYASMSLDNLQLTKTGTSTKDSDVAEVNLYDDVNRNGVIDPGENRINPTPLSYSSGIVSFQYLKLPISDTPRDVLVTYTLSPSAEGNKTLGVRVASASALTMVAGESPVVSGTFPINSGTVTANDITPPAKPLGLTVTNPGTGTSLNLSWRSNAEPDVVGYDVYRSTSLNGTYTKINVSTVVTVSYTETGLTERTSYFYKLKAIDSHNNYSEFSDPADEIPNTPPPTPTGLSVTNPQSGGTLNVTWNAVTAPDLAGYNLYRSTSANGSYSKVNEDIITATNYSDKGLVDGTIYYYEIVSVDVYELESGLSTAASNTPTDLTPPTISYTFPAPNQVRVQWHSKVKVVFDDAMNPATLTTATITVLKGSTPVSGNVSYDSSTRTAFFTPSDKWGAGSFTVTVSTGVKNSAGFNLVAPYTWQFSTTTGPHGSYTTDTGLCATCHDNHAAGEKKLKVASGTQVCIQCHDGSQTNYAVISGNFWNGEKMVPAPGGGFDPAMGVTSSHNVDTTAYPPGGANVSVDLTCASCHDPHGTSNYMLLRNSINGVTNLNVSTVVYGPGTNLPTASGNRSITYVSGITAFCSACHTDYMQYDSANNNGGSVNYRHRMGVTTTGGTTGGDRVISYAEPGLFTTLPMEGVLTGANITGTTVLPGGSLAANTYNYAITSVNGGGESKQGNFTSVTTTTSENTVTLSWEPITDAVNYRIYRYVGSGAAAQDINNYAFLAEVGDNVVSFNDNGSITPDAARKPEGKSGKIMCLTCHYAHGTKATVTEGNISLRRLDNFGVCQDCHKK
jgi:predicted CXXCH cytochrome family protein